MFLVRHVLRSRAIGRTLPFLFRRMCDKPVQAAQNTCHCQCYDGGNLDLGLADVQMPAPRFKAKAWHDGFKDISLESYKGKYVVLFFYPLDFTFVCPTEIIEFSKKAAQFREVGTCCTHLKAVRCSGALWTRSLDTWSTLPSRVLKEDWDRSTSLSLATSART